MDVDQLFQALRFITNLSQEEQDIANQTTVLEKVRDLNYLSQIFFQRTCSHEFMFLFFSDQHQWMPVVAMPAQWHLHWEFDPWSVHVQLCGWVDRPELWKSSTVLQWQHLWEWRPVLQPAGQLLLQVSDRPTSKSLVLILVGLQVSGLWTDQPDKTTHTCIVRTSSQWIGWPNKTKVSCIDRTWSQWADKPDKAKVTCIDMIVNHWADQVSETMALVLIVL